MNKKVLVVGAGTAGLGAAIRLQHAGYNVEIYEQNDTPGGKMNRIEADGHQFDVGPTIVMMPDMYREVFELAGRDPDDYIPMKKLDPMYDVYFKDDTYRRYSISSDLTELTALFESRGTENSRGFLQYLSAIYERFIVAEEHFIKRPFRKRSDMYTPFMIRQALKLKTFDSADKMMSKFVPDKDLQRMLSFQTLYIGVSPQKGPSLYNIIPMIELLYGVYFIKGGMHTMAVQMARLFTELGGIIHYSSPVEQIVTENGRVTGLKVGGELVKSDYVVSNADFPYTITKLIQEPEVRGRYTPEAVDKMDYSCSCLLFYWGVEGDAPELACHSFVIGTDLDDNLASIFDGRLIKDPSVYLHIPSQVDPEMAPPGKSTFYCLIPVPELGVAQYEYDEETIDYYREEALKTIERLDGLSDIRERITGENIYTPLDFERNFSAYRGATFGLQPTLRQSNHFRPQSKSLHCEGLYFTGSSTHPGAGVPTSLIGGKICAEELRRDEPGDSFQ